MLLVWRVEVWTAILTIVRPKIMSSRVIANVDGFSTAKPRHDKSVDCTRLIGASFVDVRKHIEGPTHGYAAVALGCTKGAVPAAS
jgi:hypothetical protein